MPFVLRFEKGCRRLQPPPHWAVPKRRTWLSEAGTAAVEFAIVGPVLLVMLLGIFTYGGYFLTAHTLQQLTNDAARASIAGLDNAERRSLAEAALRAGLANQENLHGALTSVSVRETGRTLALTVTYDASHDLYWATRTIVPAPSPQISRTATIQLGGF